MITLSKFNYELLTKDVSGDEVKICILDIPDDIITIGSRVFVLKENLSLLNGLNDER